MLVQNGIKTNFEQVEWSNYLYVLYETERPSHVLCWITRLQVIRNMCSSIIVDLLMPKPAVSRVKEMIGKLERHKHNSKSESSTRRNENILYVLPATFYIVSNKKNLFLCLLFFIIITKYIVSGNLLYMYTQKYKCKNGHEAHSSFLIRVPQLLAMNHYSYSLRSELYSKQFFTF